MLAPEYCVLEASEAEAIRFEDHLADVRLRAEARVMALGTIVAIAGPGGRGVLNLLLAGSLHGIRRTVNQIWTIVGYEILDKQPDTRQRIQPLLNQAALRLMDDWPWYEAIAPLAVELGFRLTWTWRFLAWLYRYDPILSPTHEASVFRDYCGRRQTSVHGDYLVELRFQRDANGNFAVRYDPAGKLLSPRVRYRPAPWDDPMPILITGE